MRFPSSERGFVRARSQSLPDRISEVGAQALIIYMNYNDESYIWDYPKQKIRLDGMGVSTLVIEKQHYPPVNKDQLEGTIRDFLMAVKTGESR